MTRKKMLIGSLSNDLMRVANLVQRGSNQNATRFLHEAEKWASELKSYRLETYISKIVADVKSEQSPSMELAEKYLMYSILLQNYTLKIK